MPFHAMSRVEGTAVVGQWLPKSVIKPENPHESGQGSSYKKKVKMKIYHIQKSLMKNEVRNIKDKWKTKRNIKCKFKWTQKNMKKKKCKMKSDHSWMDMVTVESLLEKGYGYCNNVAHRFPYDRGKLYVKKGR